MLVVYSKQLTHFIEKLSHTLFVMMVLSGIIRMTSAFANTVENRIRYRIRKGTVDDIPYIQQCNRITLPENYEYSYFRDHMTSFPELVFVAEKCEDIIETSSDVNLLEKVSSENKSNRIPHRKLLGYIMGQLEYPAVYTGKQDYVGKKPQMTLSTGYSGHVTSIAVYKEYRGQGIAKGLLNSLHECLGNKYKVDVVSLKCRVSNTAALKLYTECYDYKCRMLVPQYYQDNEDAWHVELSGLQNLIRQGKYKAREGNSKTSSYTDDSTLLSTHTSSS